MIGKKKALVLGKFLPIHKGHIHLLDTAGKDCDLTIVVCSLTTEPICGKKRFQWMKELFPDARVVHLDKDDMPQEPIDENDFQFWERWKHELKLLHPEKIDYVFSSETYGYRLADTLEAEHIIVDLDRKTVPISGTKIRENPYKHWDYIPDTVKPHFVKKVLITGAESCGKTTMSQMLAKEFNTNWCPEWARENWDSINGWGFTIEGLNKVADGQAEYLKEAIKSANRITFSDTSAIETHIYSKLYLGNSSDVIDSHLSNISKNFDLILLLTPSVKFVQDGLRKAKDKRWELHAEFKEKCDSTGLPVMIIDCDGDYEKRYSEAVKACTSLLDN